MHFFSKPLGFDKEFYYRNFILHVVRNFRQKAFYLSISKEGYVCISCSKNASMKQICNFVDEHQKWIEKQISQKIKLKKFNPQKRLLSGESFPFCGENKRLRIIRSAHQLFAAVKGSEIQIHWPPHIGAKKAVQALQKLYRTQGEHILKQKIQFYSQKMNLHPSKISFRAQKSLFGSCSENGHISLNWTLTAAPQFVMDYVVIHELAHLKYLKHSISFWRYVKSHCPAYLKAEKWLNTKAHQMDFLSEVS